MTNLFYNFIILLLYHIPFFAIFALNSFLKFCLLDIRLLIFLEFYYSDGETTFCTNSLKYYSICHDFKLTQWKLLKIWSIHSCYSCDKIPEVLLFNTHSYKNVIPSILPVYFLAPSPNIYSIVSIIHIYFSWNIERDANHPNPFAHK